MDALMSSILTNARAKTASDKPPLDLSWNSFTRHTCDRLINLEDLRTDQSITQAADIHMEEDVASTKPLPRGISQTKLCHTPDEVTVKQVPSSSPPTKLQKAVHPFSIAALIGESDCDIGNVYTTPAQVYSPYMTSSLQYQDYLFNSNYFQRTSSQKDPDVSDLSSPIRAVSMLNTKNVYWCHVCNALCEDKNESDRHKLVHRIHGSRSNLRRVILKEHGHVTVHEQMDNDRLKCGLCHKVVSSCFFSKHQRLHDGHFCGVCAQEFSTNSRLQDHMNVHTGRMPFSCTVCDRKFAKRSSLTQHQRYHRDHKSFMCKFCYKYFNSKYACAVHERLHTGENPFKCHFQGCAKAFPQKIQLKLHLNSHHRV